MIPPKEPFAAFTRKVIEDHDEWDSLHHFLTLFWSDGELHVGTWAAIDPGIDPPKYELLMRKIALQEFEKEDEHAYAYLLQVEGHGVTAPGPGASLDEVAAFERARRERTFHQRPDAVEGAYAWCADIHGRMWSATKQRDKPGVIEEMYFPPGEGPGGQMVTALLQCALATGHVGYGLPLPERLPGEHIDPGRFST